MNGPTSTGVATASEAEEAFRLLGDALPHGAWLARADGQRELHNRALVELLGASAEDLSGERWMERVHPEDLAQVRGAWQRAVRDGASHRCTFRVRARDGAWRWVEERAQPRRDPVGRIDGWIGVTTDIHEQREALSSRRRAARELRESEERLRHTLDRAPLPTAIVAEDGRLVLVNEALRRMSGFEPRDVPDVQSWERLAYGIDRDVLSDRVRALFDLDGPTDEGEHVIRIREGEERLWHFHVAPIGRGRDGRRQIVVMAVDVTEQRLAEDAARRSDRRLHAYFRSANVGIARLDGRTGCHLEVNDTYAGFVGRSCEALRDLGLAHVLGGSQDPGREEPGGEGARGEGARGEEAGGEEARGDEPPVRPVERCFRRPDGTIRWGLLHVLPIEVGEADAEGAPDRFVTVVDVTGLHEALEALRMSEERLRLATEAARAMVYDVPLADEGHYETIGSERLLGLSHREIASSRGRWVDRIHPEDRDGWLAALGRLRKEWDQATHEYRVRHRDGHYVVVLDRGRVVDHTGGGRVVGVLVDISERKRYERALERAHRHKNEFMASLGHELRNPLAAIRYALQLLQAVPDDDGRIARSAEVIDRQTLQMKRLLDDLLDVSRVQRGKIRIERGVVDLVEVVREVVAAHEPALRARGLDLEVSLPEEAVTLRGDRTRLAQALGNLLGNSMKFTEAPGRVAVQVGREGEEAVCRITDDGVGIEPEFLPHIFEPFQQAAASEQRPERGLGLGLALVRGIVELHGGRVSAESGGLGAGASFVVRLPLGLEEGRPVEPPSRRRILVLEDEPVAAAALEAMLLRGGYDARVASDPAMALRLAEAFDPELVLCDLDLAGTSGFDVARALRASSEDPPLLVAFTGRADDALRVRSQEAGFAVHLVKPVDLDAIGRLVEDLSGDG